MSSVYRISSNPEEMNLDKIHAFITRSYWAAGITKETLRTAVQNSICFGVFHESQGQVGFARMISDKSTFAYLADVFILEEHRGKGLSKRLLESIVEHPDFQGLRRIVLATADAHELYRNFGFTELSKPELFMEKWNPDIYKQPNP